MNCLSNYRKICARLAVIAMVVQLVVPLYPGFSGALTSAGANTAFLSPNFCLPPDAKATADLPASQGNTPSSPQNSVPSCSLCILCQSTTFNGMLVPQASETANGLNPLRYAAVWFDQTNATSAKYFDRHTTRAPPATI